MNLLGDTGDSMLRESARRALAGSSPHAVLTASPEAIEEIAARHFAMAGELGWTTALLDESDGGLGLGCEALVEICEEMGAHLFCGPWLASAVLVPCLLRVSREGGARFDWPGPDAAVTLAVRLPGAGNDTRARYLAEHPALATHYLFVDVTARERLVFRLRDTSAVEIHARPASLDPSCPAAIVSITAGEANPGIELAARDDALAPLNLALAAELTGVTAAVLERSLAWVSERRQFSRPVGSFQAVKHRLADTYVDFSKALHLTRAAAASGDAGAAAMARVLAANAADIASRRYIQHLGGAGISWEVDAHLYLKRTRRLIATPPSTALLGRGTTDAFIASVDAAGAHH